jgi:two-component system, chemotaxis family, protein-glutamate methylesterase/glutaminase
VSERRPGLRRRVLVVDDSALIRTMVRDIIQGPAGFRVVGEAGTGFEAIRLVHELDPDIVTLDLEMPDLGGLDALAYIMERAPRPVVVLSAHSRRGAEPTLRALELGAVECVLKPVSGDAVEPAAMARGLVSALHLAAAARVPLPEAAPRIDADMLASATAPLDGGPALATRRMLRRVGAMRRATSPPLNIVAIAASTGGPQALSRLIPRIPAGLPAAIVIVQHLPPGFTRSLASRLNAAGALAVMEAADGQPITAGAAYVAPGGAHLSLERREGRLVFAVRDAGRDATAPAADRLFRSVARQCGPGSMGIVLTGMGRDGADGLRAIRDVGGWTIAQDAGTSMIYGMPRAAASFARQVLPLDHIPAAIVTRVGPRWPGAVGVGAE